MAGLQANDAAYDSPIAVNLQDLATENAGDASKSASVGTTATRPPRALALYATAMQTGFAGQNSDPNGQAGKERFFNQDIQDLGYLLIRLFRRCLASSSSAVR